MLLVCFRIHRIQIMVDEVPIRLRWYISCVDILLKAFGQERPASFLSIIWNDGTNEVISTKFTLRLTELYIGNPRSLFSFRHMLLKIAQCYNYFWHESKRRVPSLELKLSWNNISSLWFIANRVGFQVTLTSCQFERFIEYLYVEETLLLVEAQLIHSPCTWTHACARDTTSSRSGIFVTHYEFKPTSATLCDFLVPSMMRA